MRYLVLILGLLLASLSSAKTKGFEIQVNEVSINGSLDIQSKKMKVQPNQSVVISRSFDSSGVNTIVEMTVSDDNSMIKDGILIILSIIQEKNGSKKIVGKPQMIVKVGQEAQMTQGKEGETPFFTATLVAKRVH